MHHLARNVVSGLALLGASLAGIGCQGVNPADPYLGTIDGSGFDPLFRGGTSGCLAPRRGYGGASGVDVASWYYLGSLSRTQLDISGATDLTRTPPTGAYAIQGCTVHEAPPFDARTDNYVKTAQYPILANASVEPTTPASYKPWHLVVPVKIREGREVGCNDVKGQRSLEDRAGWDREKKVYGRGDFDPAQLASYPYGYSLPDGDWAKGLDLQPVLPTRADIAAGKYVFKDWPMVNVAMPVMKTASLSQSCPLTSGNKARYPRFPGDPSADFQFPQQAWLRGLLSGYLDGGDLPVTTDPMKCPAIVNTGRSCPMGNECDSSKAEVCTMGRCQGRLPICPIINEVFVPASEAMALATGTVELSDGGGKRTADVLAIFAATPGQAGYSPVCRLRTYDPAKLTCGRKEAEAIAPRPLCTAAEIVASGAAAPATDTFIHCLFPVAQKQ